VVDAVTLDKSTVLAALTPEAVLQPRTRLKRKRWPKCEDPTHERAPRLTRQGKPTTICKTCVAARRRILYAERTGEPPNLRKLWLYLRTAKSFSRSIRRLRCTLTLEQFVAIRSNPCFYCGGELPRTGCGLDRKEPTRGYDLDNVVPACTRCNHARGAFITFDEFALIMRMRRERLGPDADLWSEHPPSGLLITVRRSR
jgi:hypothetical protein